MPCRDERTTEVQDIRHVEVCFSPALFQDILTQGDFIVVLVDILRATTTICTAVANGVGAIIPVATHAEARQLKSQGLLVASEKDGVQVDFADFGNSAFSFTRDAIGGKTLVYCTTNGTRTLEIAQRRQRHRHWSLHQHLGSDGVAGRPAEGRGRSMLGWKNKFCLEDALFAGALTGKLLQTACSTPSAIQQRQRWNCGAWPRTTCWATSRRPLSATV